MKTYQKVLFIVVVLIVVMWIFNFIGGEGGFDTSVDTIMPFLFLILFSLFSMFVWKKK